MDALLIASEYIAQHLGRQPASKPAPSGGVADMESDIPF